MPDGISPNPLNDISKVYLDTVARVKKTEVDKDIQRWQTEDSEYGYDEKGHSKNPLHKGKKVTKVQAQKESFSDWRSTLREVTSDAKVDGGIKGGFTDTEFEKEVKEKKIKNKIIINPKLGEAVEQMGGQLLEVTEVEDDEEEKDLEKADALKKKEAQLKKRIVRMKMQAVNQGAGETIIAGYEPDIEGAVEYFYEEGINEEGIDLIIEEIGLEEFVDFVDDSSELLIEERAARKMNVRSLKATKKKAEEIKATKKDVVARSTPKDVLSRARTERLFKKPKLAQPAPKKEAPKPVAKKPTPKPAPKPVVKKAVAKVKPTQPKKPASKEGLRAKIKSVYDAGVKRHRKATQPIRVFHKGMKKAPKAVAKAAVDVKRAIAPRKEGFSNWRGDLVEKDLNAAERRALPDKDFVFPGKGEGPEGKQRGAYPINDKKHARNALAMAAAHASPAKQAKVKAAVKKKFPDIQVSEEKKVLPKLKMYRKAGNLARKGDPESMKRQTKMVSVLNKETEKGYKKAALDKLRDGGSPKHQTNEAIERQAKDRKKLSQPHSVSGSRRDHSHDVDSALTDHVPRKGKGRIRPASKKEMRVSAMREDKKVDFIKQLVRENDAYKTTVANLKKEFGDGVLASKQDFEDHKKREAAKPKPKPKPQKPLSAAEKAQKEVDAQYGRTAWDKKGSLGT